MLSLYSLFQSCLNKKQNKTVGQIIPVMGLTDYVPEGTLPCDGAEYNKQDYLTLWNKYLIGTKKIYYAWRHTAQSPSDFDFTIWTKTETPIAGTTPILGGSGRGPLSGWYLLSVDSPTQITITITSGGVTNTYVCIRESSLDEKNRLLVTCSVAEYTNYINTFGQCPAWTVNPNGTFRTPLIKNGAMIQQALDAMAIGAAYNPGLPNITGDAGTQPGLNGTYRLNGAFYSNANNVRVDSGSSNSWDFPNLAFDASRSNPIYGASNTVQPIAVTARYFVVI